VSRALSSHRIVGALAALGAVLLSPRALAQPAELAGDWFLTLNERRAVHTGILTIERSGARSSRSSTAAPQRSRSKATRLHSISIRATAAANC
jgi:hypothetical protein